MKQLIIKNPYNAMFEEVPVPIPRPNELLVKTEVSGVSAGTEMTLYRGTHPNFITKKWGYWTDYPVYPGYEVVGTVESIGSEVTNFQPGDRVVGCGIHAEKVLIPANYAVKLPEQISSEEGLLAILGTTTMHAIHRSSIKYGDSIAIIGLGVVGMLTLLHSKLAGAGRVIAIDLNQKRLSIAASFGVTAVINAQEEDFYSKVEKATEGGPDIVIEATGASEAIITATRIARPRGLVVVLGYHVKPVELLFGDDLYHKELDIHFSKAMGPHPSLPQPNAQWGGWIPARWTVDQTLKQVVGFMAEGKFDIKPLITHHFNCEELPDIFRKIDKGEMEEALQIVLKW